jgi:hypothetical protein
MSSSGKIYYLKTEELAILLAIEGLNSFYGIKLNMKNLDNKLVYETMFKLQKQGILLGNGKSVSITYEIKEVIENLKSSKILITCQSKSLEYPQKFIYLGKCPVIICPYGINSDILQIEIGNCDGLVEKICSEGFSIEQFVSDESLYNRCLIENESIQQNAEKIFKSVNIIEDEKWGCAVCCLRLIDIANKKFKRQYLLIQDKLNDYIAVTDKNDTKIYAYSMKLVSEILNEDLEGLK